MAFPKLNFRHVLPVSIVSRVEELRLYLHLHVHVHVHKKQALTEQLVQVFTSVCTSTSKGSISVLFGDHKCTTVKTIYKNKHALNNMHNNNDKNSVAKDCVFTINNTHSSFSELKLC